MYKKPVGPEFDTDFDTNPSKKTCVKPRCWSYKTKDKSRAMKQTQSRCQEDQTVKCEQEKNMTYCACVPIFADRKTNECPEGLTLETQRGGACDFSIRSGGMCTMQMVTHKICKKKEQDVTS